MYIMDESGHIEGANTSTLMIINVLMNDWGMYSCKASNIVDNVTSNEATLHGMCACCMCVYACCVCVYACCVYTCVYACVCVCACACMCDGMCIRVWACACKYTCMCTDI